MSSIDTSNALATTISSDSTLSSEMPWGTLTPEERKRLAAAQEQIGSPDVTGVMGMTPKQLLRMAQTGQVNKFSTAAAANKLPPPSAPKVQVTQYQITRYQTMARDVNHALSQTARAQPPMQRPPQGNGQPTVQQQVNANTTPPANATGGLNADEAHQVQLSQMVTQALSGMSSGDLMSAFLALQVQDQNSGLQTRQTLSNMLCQNRQGQLQLEIQQDKQAEAAVQKALAKARQMGVLSKVLAVFMVIVTAVLAVATLGFGVGLALVAASMAIGALAGGLKDGKKNGNGFDLEGALNGAALAGGIATAVVGLGAALAAMGEIGMQMASTSVKEVMQKAEQIAANESKELFEELVKKLQQEGKQMTAKAQKQIMDQIRTIAKSTVSKPSTGADINPAQWAMKSQGKIGAIKQLMTTAMGPKMGAVTKPMWDVVKDGSLKVEGDLAKSGLVANPRMWKVVGLTALGGRGVGQSIQAGMQYKANQYNLDAETHENLSSMAQLQADTSQSEYEDLQNFMQQVSQSHNDSVNKAMSMLSNHFQTQMRSAQAMVSG